MNEMIERVAIEIGGLDNDRCNPCTAKKIVKCKDCLDAAKRVIKVMLKPTNKMHNAMCFAHTSPLAIWNAGINEALKE